MRDEDIMEIPGLDGYGASRDGRIWSRFTGQWRELRGEVTIHGYHRVELRGRKYSTHRLILTTFVGPGADGHEARHLNGNKLDNRAENLTWGTAAENWNDRRIHGTDSSGERHHMARLTWEQVEAIRADTRSRREIADEHGIKPCTVTDIRLWRTWKNPPRSTGSQPEMEQQA